MTILFTDLVGSTARAEGLDPEDVRATLSAYYAQLRAELERHGGTVEKFIGDAVMAVFGAPVAHEDDAERAVRAALAIRDSIGDELQIRTAVNTGEALVALDAKPGEGDAMVAGDVVNTAARLQSAAPVNGILVGEGTYRATRDAIDYREAPAVEAKGKAEPVKVWEAVAARSRFGSDVEQRLRTPLVGRERERRPPRRRARTRRARSSRRSSSRSSACRASARAASSPSCSRSSRPTPTSSSWRQGRSLPYGERVSFWALGEIVKAQAGILESDDAATAEREARRDGRDAGRGRRRTGLAGPPHALRSSASRATERTERERGVRGVAPAVRGGAPSSDRSCSSSRISTGPTTACSTSSTTSPSGSTTVPLLIVATARPELLDRRPGWGGGKRNAFDALDRRAQRRARPPMLLQRLLDRAGPRRRRRSRRCCSAPRATRSTPRSTRGCSPSTTATTSRSPRRCRV